MDIGSLSLFPLWLYAEFCGEQKTRCGKDEIRPELWAGEATCPCALNWYQALVFPSLELLMRTLVLASPTKPQHGML